MQVWIQTKAVHVCAVTGLDFSLFLKIWCRGFNFTGVAQTQKILWLSFPSLISDVPPLWTMLFLLFLCMCNACVCSLQKCRRMKKSNTQCLNLDHSRLFYPSFHECQCGKEVSLSYPFKTNANSNEKHNHCSIILQIING